MIDLLTREEDLHEDLVPHLVEHADLPYLHHPLIIEPIYAPAMNAMINARYQAKLEALAQALPAGQFYRYVHLHEKPYRFDALAEIDGSITDDREFWELVASVWVGSENIYENERDWRALLSCGRSQREHMMDDDERRQLTAFGDVVRVFRGFRLPGRDQGLSWTTDEEQARWFACRWDGHAAGEARIVHGTVATEDVIAFLTARGESEIVCLPEHVNVHSTDDCS
jgi:hypothetical protein